MLNKQHPIVRFTHRSTRNIFMAYSIPSYRAQFHFKNTVGVSVQQLFEEKVFKKCKIQGPQFGPGIRNEF